MDNGGGHACVEVGSIGEIFVSSSQFCCEPKTVLKKKVFKSFFLSTERSAFRNNIF